MTIPWTDDMIRSIAILRDDNKSVDAIAEAIGVDVGTFRKFRKRTNYCLRPIARSGRLQNPGADYNSNDGPNRQEAKG